ncbi:thioredoxin F2, chloroplastic-like [Malania oleifera]|uniref:thioredoxin F2, chloroplastic-like n=1 Tax=Malania oleifera TaxID=397392 RepID=UPI0025AE50B2|nr:thioredoxin F2, chloroplastic-like [Malania oleifera]
MALQLSLSSAPALRSPSSAFAPPVNLSSDLLRCSGALRPTPKTSVGGVNRRRENAGVWVVRGSLDTAIPVVGRVTEVTKDTFWPLVKAAADKSVVLDMYTQWCGPCKVIAPKFQELSEKYLDVLFLKLDCNQENKALAKELGIKVVPTFKILKDSKIVKEVTGAKLDDLVAAIEAVRSS